MNLPVDLATLARSVIGIGFNGATVHGAPLDVLRAFEPGAFILFGRNVGTIQELWTLVGALRAGATPPPLILVDQEGGRVERIRSGVTSLPAAMAIGATGDTGLAQRLGDVLARDLRALGISVDLAPDADLALRPESTVIATRAFGDDPERVGAFVTAFARGLENAGVAATVKHFPGHGSTPDDSHVSLPRITADAPTLRERDLVPFRRAIETRAASIVMTAHVVVEAFDPERPATLSPRVLTELLRDELGFTGVVVTDCMEMDAIARGVGTVRGGVEALAAGADLVLISHRLELAEETANAIVAAVEGGEIPRERLEAAYHRVLTLRRRLADSHVDGTGDRDAPLEAARRAVTVVRGEPRLEPGKPVTVISFEGAAIDNAATSGSRAHLDETTLSSMLRRRGWKSEVMRVPLEPAADEVDVLLEHIPALGDRSFVVVTRDAHLHRAQAEAVRRVLAAAPDALIVSGRSPFDALLWPAAKRVICIYGTQPISLEGCADVLIGRVPAAGTLPVRLDRDAAVR